ncbi:MAG: Asp-tRNA(Asn)/Glu-tRNA(Gln) amidotransferase subunit GatC [Rickettsiales bacterium]|jgi:aspartyl-tRNA(Asn)/glutamyl-tRNA(Gln) amidotransferase subunit C|nr:Asp-tRNA(Asn)/Glu-tRNA(Gln) amidotransferase subunit GatC [Rickettsiales bacterium]
MAFTKQQLQKFAHSIRIEISDEELAAMNIDQVFSWMEQMKQVDTTGIEPMFTPAEHAAPLRDDVVTDGNCRDAVLANTPDDAGKSRGYFAVPKIIDEE